jgi:hypothetical protein
LPFLITGSISDVSLIRLGNIGQLYGAASAALSALAVLAVAFSLAYQARQDQHNRLTSWRSSQENLLRLAIDQPKTFAPCLMDVDSFDSLEDLRRFLYITQWLAFMRIGLDLGQITEREFRQEFCRGMFASPVGPKLWLLRRDALLNQYGYLDEFLQAVDDEYRNSLKKTVPTPPAENIDKTDAPST